MEIVTYDSKTNQWVGKFNCTQCGEDTPAWKSSGMSESWPHFYCSDCSNVILRPQDKMLAWEEQNSQILERIVGSLPECECGGSFVANSNPKCPNCGFEFKHQDDAVKRLTDPHMILIDGAVRYDENGPRHQIKIV